MKRLHDKYTVFKNVEGTEKPLEKVHNAFILKWDTDPIARKALAVYAKQMELIGETDFARDLYKILQPYKLEANKRHCPVCGSQEYMRRVKEVLDPITEKYVEEEDYCICGECGNLFR